MSDLFTDTGITFKDSEQRTEAITIAGLSDVFVWTKCSPTNSHDRTPNTQSDGIQKWGL